MIAMETPHELEARRRYARICGRPVCRFRVEHCPVPEFLYDFFDPATGKYGQCRLDFDGRWSQAPLGEQPVVLEYLE
jgi:hypothetical protein